MIDSKIGMDLLKLTKIVSSSEKLNVADGTKYPILKYFKHDYATECDSIVLFTSPGAGILVYSTGDNVLGEYADDWSEESFYIYDGTVEMVLELSNDIIRRK